jgi:ABC-type maltose transport system permease subunit
VLEYKLAVCNTRSYITYRYDLLPRTVIYEVYKNLLNQTLMSSLCRCFNKHEFAMHNKKILEAGNHQSCAMKPYPPPSHKHLFNSLFKLSLITFLIIITISILPN